MTNNKQQRGIVLVLSLILLILLTLLGVTAMQSSGLEEKMAGNYRNYNTAFQAAESALREAEGLINTAAPAGPFNPLKLFGGPFQNTDSNAACVAGICGPGDSSVLQSTKFPAIDGAMISANTGINDISSEPQYIIELIGTEPSADSSLIYASFRITARAWGGNDRSTVQLQSTYKIHTPFVN